MISLPPGVTITHEIQITMSDLPDGFLEWWKEIGGSCVMSGNHRGLNYEPKMSPIIWYNAGRKSHKLAGSHTYIIRFNKEDANTAIMVLLMFNELIDSHNISGLVENEY